MNRYRIAPARPVCLSAAGPGAALSGRRPGGAEIGIFTAERYFSAADVVRRAVVIPAPPALPDPDHELPRLSVPAADVASQSGRTAVSSEASWNSRSGLLSASGAHSAASRQQKATSAGAGYGSDQGYHRGGRKTGGGSGQRWTLFGRDCPCAGRKAVTVDVASEPRSPTAAQFTARFSPQSAVEECLESDIFKPKQHPSPPRAAADHHQEAGKVKITVTPGSRAFPLAADNVFAAAPNWSADDVPFAAFKPDIDRRVVTSGGFTFPSLGAGRVVSGSVLDEPPRVSLEVFRPIDEDSVMLADPPPAMPLAGRAGQLPLPRAPPPAAAPVDEEAMSDASSDLFDLESFAASSSYPTTYRGRGSCRSSADDDLPAYASAAAGEPALSECMYPASEASVVWSVATAEGGTFDAASVANFSSAASACCVDDLRYMVLDESPEVGFTAAMSRSAGRKKSGGGGFLNSCRCEKAVSVGPTPVRVVRPPAHPGAAAKKQGSDGAARYHPGRAHVPVRT
ncbi:hypothetical protein BAE44_0001474 [Dichanthelium oligosanthes]|uniref:Protein PHYTOCHROME KINASE SUBSTRATE 4 n=1 Tax=Dichanthelium oligosanthes TaxID=888268 RepID=A0A1E5WJ95_9POAL|nr:hypothetical protein BAE44_0001474 [Dichanthelium oligosanthes]